MQNFRGSKEDITHVLFHSCTGFKAPGIELDIIQELELPNVKRKFGVNFMGCFGGFTILQTAKYICEAEPGSHVLFVCCELCTLHQGAEDHRSTQMGIVLFGDAAAAGVVGPGRPGDWTLTQGESVVLPKESKNAMTWLATDTAYRMWLDKSIGPSLGKALRGGWQQWFSHALGHCDPASVEWAVHPGGKAILEMVLHEQVGVSGPSDRLSPEHLRHSFSVLRDVGNVSSATIIFVLERMLKETTRDEIFMLGFGPGLTVEYTGLRKVQEPSTVSGDGEQDVAD
jgi:predicted naringenin-chalcone synthase